MSNLAIRTGSLLGVLLCIFGALYFGNIEYQKWQAKQSAAGSSGGGMTVAQATVANPPVVNSDTGGQLANPTPGTPCSKKFYQSSDVALTIDQLIQLVNVSQKVIISRAPRGMTMIENNGSVIKILQKNGEKWSYGTISTGRFPTALKTGAGFDTGTQAVGRILTSSEDVKNKASFSSEKAAHERLGWSDCN